MHVIGTAGHVDHGKSTLVKALTGIDPDRLREEKEREMTIVLGFAWLTLPNGEAVGIVDVPGHKDFIKNMLAGVGGIDAALLVVAADEGVMPQTREHLAILDLLNLGGGVIALTKTDLVDDPEWLELVIADTMEEVEGTCLEGAPLVPVSAHTGEGLDELIVELQKCLQNVPERRDLGRPRLSVDRVFTISGFGTVVTGTLVDGTLRIGQEVEIVPAGRDPTRKATLPARIRGLQTHKEQIEVAVPGSRVAINLGGVGKDQVRIGAVVTTPGWLRPTTLVDVQLRQLADAGRPLKHNAEVDFFCGAAEVPARVRLLGTDALAPGETGWAQLRLSRPVALVRGDRFIVRRLSPSATIGGGVVIDPLPRRRHRRFKPAVIAWLETLTYGTPEEIALQTLRRREPCTVGDLLGAIVLPPDEARRAIGQLLNERQAFVLDDLTGGVTALSSTDGGRFLISAAGWQSLSEQLGNLLGEYHRTYPLRKGMPREELRSRLQDRLPHLNGRSFNQVIARAVHEGLVAEDEARVWLAEHAVRLTPEQRRRVDDLLASFRRKPYTPPSVAECVSQLGEELFNLLVAEGTLVRVSAEVVYLRETLDEMRERVVERIARDGGLTIAQVRDMFDASRKYALALMEYLDRERVTKRVGDIRVLRHKPGGDDPQAS